MRLLNAIFFDYGCPCNEILPVKRSIANRINKVTNTEVVLFSKNILSKHI